jgi:hypothetical protein
MGARRRTGFFGALLLGGLGWAFSAAGCAFGPKALERTHGRYNESIKEVSEEQLLLNLVRLRYNDSPSRLDVSSIAAQYELSGMAQAQPFFTAQASAVSDLIRSFTAVLPSAQVLGANRPTVSLTPADDRTTVRRFLTPLDPEELFFFAQSGWPISLLFRLYVEYLNGVPNAPSAGGPVRDVVPTFETFLRVVELLQVVQDRDYARIVAGEKEKRSGGPVPNPKVKASDVLNAAKAEYEYRTYDKDTWELVKTEKKLLVKVNPDAVSRPEIQELCQLLRLQPGQLEYEVKLGDKDPYLTEITPQTLSSLRIVPRSAVQVLFFLSHGVQVPVEHLNSGIAKATVGPDGEVFDWQRLTGGVFSVHSSKQHCRPRHAHVAVKYYGYWFYIDDRDQESKTTFTFVQQLVRLDVAPKEKEAAGPVLTLPVGR